VKLILRNFQSPGDILMLTATVRDLHACYPGRFVTDVRTSCPDLWLYNPHLTPLSEDDPEVQVVDCHYPLVDRINTAPYHFLHGFTEYLNERLGLQVKPTQFKGDVHLSPAEADWFQRVEEAKGRPPRFWLFTSGGKFDYTIKWWSPRRYQEVVEHFRGRLDFVQVGEDGHHHPPLDHVIDLRGQTTLRQLVRLMHHAEGAISAVSLLMHLAAAVPTKPGLPQSRACVVIAGGREPPHFTAYPHHQYLHTVGALRCCDQGGCWKSRTLPLGDGDAKDSELCVDVVGDQPRCMAMITTDDVVRAVERYYQGGALPPLSAEPPGTGPGHPGRPSAGGTTTGQPSAPP
jgi:ADP-heptose:LPS heptosyltransferase